MKWYDVGILVCVVGLLISACVWVVSIIQWVMIPDHFSDQAVTAYWRQQISFVVLIAFCIGGKVFARTAILYDLADDDKGEHDADQSA